MRRVGLWVVMAAVGLAAALPVDAAPRRGSITFIQNRVEVKKQRASWQKAQLRSLVAVGDSIRTGPDSRADITFTDGSKTRLGANGWLTLQDQGAKSVHLMFGKLWLKIQKGTGGIRVRTPSAVAAVTGTEFLIEVTPDQTTNVTVLEGSVEVTGQIEGALVNLMAGHSTSVAPNNAPTAPIQIDMNQFRQREQLVPSEAETEDHVTSDPSNHGTGDPTSSNTNSSNNNNGDPNSATNSRNPEAASVPTDQSQVIDKNVVIENPRPVDISPTTGDLEVIVK